MKNSNDPLQILIVDDDESQLALIGRFLKKRIVDKVDVTTTTNTHQALGLAVANRVDICLTDLDMPDRNGIELLKMLKDTNPLILVIVLTAIASENALRSSLAFGADDFLRKPLQWESLAGSVRFQISRLKRYRNEINSNENTTLAVGLGESEQSREALKLIYSLHEISARLVPALQARKITQVSMLARQLEMISAQGKLSKINSAAKEVQRQVKEHSSIDHLNRSTQELSHLCHFDSIEASGYPRED